MEKRILLAVDGSINSMEAVHYAAQMKDTISDVRYALMVIQPVLSQYLLEEAQIKPQARAALEKAIKANKAKAVEILTQVAERMILRGVDENRIEQLTKARDTGVAADLLVTGEAKPYDAILVGRRGASYLREWVLGSVTANLVEHSKQIPIWVVDGAAKSSDVLLAADGSRASLRALDHMAFMLAAQENRLLNVLHVRPRFQDYCEIDLEAAFAKDAHEAILDKDRQCMDDFNDQALAILEKYNIDANRFKVSHLDGRLSISRSVIQYAGDHHIGTIVIGRRGTNKNPFTGSVSRSILNKAKDIALWVVP